MTVVKQILQKKGAHVWTVTPDAEVEETIKLMEEQDIGVVMVVGAGKKIEGVFSERDFTRAVALDKDLSLISPVSELMTKNVLYVNPEMSSDECMALMIEKRVRHLPVVENEELIGLLSMRDLVKDVVSEKEITIRGLENYIMHREYQG